MLVEATPTAETPSNQKTMPMEFGTKLLSQTSLREDSAEKETKEAKAQEIMEMVADVQINLNRMHQIGLQFAVHESSGRIKVTVIDENTGKVIREIPNEEILNLAAKFDEMIGMIFDRQG